MNMHNTSHQNIVFALCRCHCAVSLRLNCVDSFPGRGYPLETDAIPGRTVMKMIPLKRSPSLNAIPRTENSMPIPGVRGILCTVHTTCSELARPAKRMSLGIEDIVVKTYQVGRREHQVKVLERLSKPKTLYPRLAKQQQRTENRRLTSR